MPACTGRTSSSPLLEVVVGASAGILAGFLLAVVMAEFQIIERAVMPLVIIVMVTPIVAIAPGRWWSPSASAWCRSSS